ncbi:MAG: 5-oxoprolinase [Proteobacteria bacterium]|nr:MAG: 5-oxoprolinase [Pseudomonadota bacterium]
MQGVGSDMTRGRVMTKTSRSRVAVDVGGTFMDFVLLDETTGEVRIEKEASIPEELANQFLLGISRFGIDLAALDQIFHGMTVGVNALVQEKGARVGLITTKGFRDVLELGRGNRKEVYNYLYKGPPPLVERYLRREVPERLNAKGEVITPLDLAALDREVDYLVAEGVGAVALAFLHAYANPGHEIAARDRIAARYPKLAVSVSHELASEWREYERTTTTVLNAFIQPLVKNYLEDLTNVLGNAGYRKPLAIMQSNGGACDAHTAGEKPIRTLMSGPAGGVIGAKFLSDKLGYGNVICADVGGTTYDVAIIEGGKILERTETQIAGRPILGSLIDITSIGAGGGSIAWLDHRRGFRVGPQSAGASPGPACFGRGGTEPTVTDAHLVLGRLDPDNFLGGRMALDGTAARRVIEEKIAKPLGLSLYDAAEGILAIAETNMANAIRTKTVERGLDPREFMLLSYGGGGGLFAAGVAEELEIPRTMVPVAPANFSAWGILATDYIEDDARTKVMPFDRDHIGDILNTLAGLEDNTAKAVQSYGFKASEVAHHRRLDLRFKGQEYTITVELDANTRSDTAVLRSARRQFVDAHRQLYGHGDADADLEIVSVRCRAVGRVNPPTIAPLPVTGKAPIKTRDVHFREAGGFVATKIIDRDSMASGVTIEGPAIVEEWTTTTLAPPGWQVTRDEYGNLMLEPRGERK